MIEAEAKSVIRASREAVWRHLTRVSDWYRWYPGLHGVDSTELIHRVGHSWRATGQMGRLFYRSDQVVTEYERLTILEILGDRRPWLYNVRLRYELAPEGPNSQLSVTMSALPGFSVLGRRVLFTMFQRRVQNEADDTVQRLTSYVERSMPHH